MTYRTAATIAAAGIPDTIAQELADCLETVATNERRARDPWLYGPPVTYVPRGVVGPHYHDPERSREGLRPSHSTCRKCGRYFATYPGEPNPRGCHEATNRPHDERTADALAELHTAARRLADAAEEALERTDRNPYIGTSDRI